MSNRMITDIKGLPERIMARFGLPVDEIKIIYDSYSGPAINLRSDHFGVKTGVSLFLSSNVNDISKWNCPSGFIYFSRWYKETHNKAINEDELIVIAMLHEIGHIYDYIHKFGSNHMLMNLVRQAEKNEYFVIVKEKKMDFDSLECYELYASLSIEKAANDFVFKYFDEIYEMLFGSVEEVAEVA